MENNWSSKFNHWIIFSSVQFSHSVMSDSLWPHGLQHARLPCPSPTPRAYSNSCPSCWWCHPTKLSSVVPFSSRLQSFPAWGSFPMSRFFTSGGQSIGVSASASVLSRNIQDWFPLKLTGLISLQSKGLSKSSPNTLKALWHAPIKENVWKESNLSSKKYFIMYIKKYYARYLRNS